MAAAEPQAAIPAPAGDAPVQEPVDTVQHENEKADDAQASAEPIPPPAPASSDPSSSEKPASSDNTTSQPAVTTSAAAADSQKGKEKADAAATEKKSTSDNPPALPQKESDDSLSIEPSVPAAQTHTTGDHPVCNITLLLPTGARHPYRIDERYLAKRGVDVPDAIAGTEEEEEESGGSGGGGGKKDPFSISVYTLKELILREWREEWNDKPASPSSIRLIHFGKLLDDKEQLKSMFPPPFPVNVSGPPSKS